MLFKDYDQNSYYFRQIKYQFPDSRMKNLINDIQNSC